MDLLPPRRSPDQLLCYRCSLLGLQTVPHGFCEAGLEAVVIGVVVVEDSSDLADVWVEDRGRPWLGKSKLAIRETDGLHGVCLVCRNGWWTPFEPTNPRYMLRL